MRVQTRYAKSGNLHIAYQVFGQGAIDLVWCPGFVSNIEVYWEDPRMAHYLERLASFARVITFDKVARVYRIASSIVRRSKIVWTIFGR